MLLVGVENIVISPEYIDVMYSEREIITHLARLVVSQLRNLEAFWTSCPML